MSRVVYVAEAGAAVERRRVVYADAVDEDGVAELALVLPVLHDGSCVAEQRSWWGSLLASAHHAVQYFVQHGRFEVVVAGAVAASVPPVPG